MKNGVYIILFFNNNNKEKKINKSNFFIDFKNLFKLFQKSRRNY